MRKWEDEEEEEKEERKKNVKREAHRQTAKG